MRTMNKLSGTSYSAMSERALQAGTYCNKCVLIIDYSVTSMVNRPLVNPSKATDVAAFDLSSSVQNDTDQSKCGLRFSCFKSKT